MIHSSSVGSYRSPCFVYNFFRNVYFFFMGSDPGVSLKSGMPNGILAILILLNTSENKAGNSIPITVYNKSKRNSLKQFPR